MALMTFKNPIKVTCKKCGKKHTAEKERYDKWISGRGYYLCYGCSGQRTLDDWSE